MKELNSNQIEICRNFENQNHSDLNGLGIFNNQNESKKPINKDAYSKRNR
jgi:hypothetical protein